MTPVKCQLRMSLGVYDIKPVISGNSPPLCWLELRGESMGGSFNGGIMANYCRRPSTHRKSPSHCACVPEVDENLHHLYPRNYLQLMKSVSLSLFSFSFTLLSTHRTLTPAVLLLWSLAYCLQDSRDFTWNVRTICSILITLSNIF